MKCFNCGCQLSEKDFCTSCGTDVALYKRIIYASNTFYNEGLEKANVRDLSGAVTSLRQSLKFNKNNIEARNLLGLVYYEMGEVVQALGEWVISKNLRSKKNIADDYLDRIQSNPSLLETITQTIKKYNQALLYCQQESYDLAVIQLKKVLSLNPNYVQAHQMLALLYMQAEEWEKAKRELGKCSRIDNRNITTLRYLKEVDEVLNAAENMKQIAKKKELPDDVIKYQSGNETIIQPINNRESKGVSTVFNIGIGVAIGIAAACFLILPARISAVNSSGQEELRTVSEQLDKKTAAMEELNQKIKQLQEENTKLQGTVDTYEGNDGTMVVVDSLLKAVNIYIDKPDDVAGISAALEKIDVEAAKGVASKDFQSMYTMLLEKVGPSIAASYSAAGQEAYRKALYDEAAANYEKAAQYDTENADILYNLGNAYRKGGKKEKAIEAYTQLKEKFSGTDKARKAEGFLEELNAG